MWGWWRVVDGCGKQKRSWVTWSVNLFIPSGVGGGEPFKSRSRTKPPSVTWSLGKDMNTIQSTYKLLVSKPSSQINLLDPFLSDYSSAHLTLELGFSCGHSQPYEPAEGNTHIHQIFWLNFQFTMYLSIPFMRPSPLGLVKGSRQSVSLSVHWSHKLIGHVILFRTE